MNQQSNEQTTCLAPTKTRVSSLIHACVLSALLLSSTAVSRTFWQTTREGRSNGSCRLLSNKITATIHKLGVDIVEEAEIEATGDVRRGDPQTLEIVGEFTLAPGTALRSMLLWWRGSILKAKLKDRTVADKEYEEVVDRNLPTPPRDPALIEYLGENRYRFKIYPVTAGGSRKIRILYTVPLQTLSETNRTGYSIVPAFTTGARHNPATVPVEIRSNTEDEQWRINVAGTRRTIKFGATYIFPHEDFYSGYSAEYGNPAGFELYPADETWSIATRHHITEGPTGGYYAGAFVSIPLTVKESLDYEVNPRNIHLEATISTGQKTYISQVPSGNGFSVYIKSPEPWDGSITWTGYRKDGEIAFEIVQDLETTPTESSRLLPLVWAAKYTHVEKEGDLGALYGFVDTRMSLLALEKDRLPDDIASKFEYEGVPPLETEEIIVDPGKVSPAPSEDIIFEFTTTHSPVDKLRTRPIGIRLIGRNLLEIQVNRLPQGHNPTVLLYALNGRLVHSWDLVKFRNGRARLSVPAELKGTFVLRLKGTAEPMESMISIP